MFSVICLCPCVGLAPLRAVGALLRRRSCRHASGARRSRSPRGLTQRSHSGRGLQMRRPWRMSVSDVRVHSAGGMAAHNCCSTTSGSSDFAMPMRLATRRTWRSTGRPGTPSAWPRTTFAVLRPTPGSSTSASIVSGISPPCVSHELGRHAEERARLRAEEAGRLDLRLELVGRGARERRGVGIAREERRRDLVDALIGALRGQNRRDQELVRRS